MKVEVDDRECLLSFDKRINEKQTEDYAKPDDLCGSHMPSRCATYCQLKSFRKPVTQRVHSCLIPAFLGGKSSRKGSASLQRLGHEREGSNEVTVWLPPKHPIVDWVGLVTALAALLTAAFALYQIRLSRLSLGADLILRHAERFESNAFRQKRRLAAKALLENRDLENVEDVLDFFDTVAVLVHRKAFDKTLVWHMFFYWLHGYWLRGNNYIGKIRQKEATRYTDLLWLHDQLLKIERLRRRKLRVAPIEPPERIWDGFLQEEFSSTSAPRAVIPSESLQDHMSTIIKLTRLLLEVFKTR